MSNDTVAPIIFILKSTFTSYIEYFKVEIGLISVNDEIFKKLEKIDESKSSLKNK